MQRSGVDTIKYHTRPRIPMGKLQNYSQTPQTRAKRPAPPPPPSRRPQSTHKQTRTKTQQTQNRTKTHKIHKRSTAPERSVKHFTGGLKPVQRQILSFNKSKIKGENLASEVDLRPLLASDYACSKVVVLILFNHRLLSLSLFLGLCSVLVLLCSILVLSSGDTLTPIEIDYSDPYASSCKQNSAFSDIILRLTYIPGLCLDWSEVFRLY